MKCTSYDVASNYDTKEKAVVVDEKAANNVVMNVSLILRSVRL